VIPQALDDATLRRATSGRPLRVLARMAPHGTITGARAAVSLSLGDIGAPSAMAREVRFRVRSLRDLQLGSTGLVSWLLLGSVVLLLVLSCANVANLLLARASAKHRDLAIRVALGASRFRLATQTLTETLLLGAIGGSAGVALTFVFLRGIAAFAPAGVLPLAEAAVNGRILAFALAVSIVAGILFGLGPALVRPKREALTSGSASLIGASRLRSALVVGQIALSLGLVTSASLLVRALIRFQTTPVGLETENVVSAALSLAPHRYPDPASQLRFFTDVEAMASGIPGFDFVAVADSLPPNEPARSVPFFALQVNGKAVGSGAGGTVYWRSVTPEYFRTLRIGVVTGRTFTEADRERGNSVVILSESLSRLLFPRGNAIGARLGGREIIGVVRDVHNGGGVWASAPEYYVPRSRDAGDVAYRAPNALRRGGLVVRTRLDAAIATRLVRSAIAQVDPHLPVTVESMASQTARLAARPRFNALLLSIFAAAGLALAAFGLYGVISLVVRERTREIGLRMALGSTPAGASRLVLRHVARWVIAGSAAGCLVSLGLANAMRSLLYGVSPWDATSWSAAAVALAVVALLAAWLPARRAGRVDPMDALRV
jgi:predicted permease